MLASQAPIVSNSELHAASEAFEGASLGLLRLVDQTCDSLTTGTKAFRGLAGVLDNLASRIRALPARVDEYIDPTDEGIESLRNAVRQLADGRPHFVQKKAAINLDRELAAHHRDILHGSYDDFLEAIDSALESAQRLIGAVIRHDLAAEPRNGVRHTDSARLIDSLHKLVK